MKKTTIHQVHLPLKPKMIDFRGWQVPARFSDSTEEHQAVRRAAGLFDIGFLGRIEISGAGAAALLQSVFTRDVDNQPENSVRYGLLCAETGAILSDALLFRLPQLSGDKTTRFLLTVVPDTTELVLEHLARQAKSGEEITDRTGFTAHFSLQGPASTAIAERICAPHFKKLRSRQVKALPQADRSAIIARVGWTGEDGYELIVPAEDAPMLWNSILEKGRDAGVIPCGMECRDLLRLEAGYPLYGNDIDVKRTPFEAGLGAFVDLAKDFIGRDALQKLKESGVTERLAGFALPDRSIPKNGGSIFVESREIGMVTSAALSPSLRSGIGMGYILSRYAKPGQEVDVELKNGESAAKIVELPFHRKK